MWIKLKLQYTYKIVPVLLLNIYIFIINKKNLFSETNMYFNFEEVEEEDIKDKFPFHVSGIEEVKIERYVTKDFLFLQRTVSIVYPS